MDLFIINIKLNLNKLQEFSSYEDQATSNIIKTCSFYTCNYCQGRPKNFKLTKNKGSNPTKKQYNPKAPEKICKYKECKYCNKLLRLIEEKREKYYINLALTQREKEQGGMDVVEKERPNDIGKNENNTTENAKAFENIIETIDLKKGKVNQIEEKLKKVDANKLPQIEIRGDGSCLY